MGFLDKVKQVVSNPATLLNPVTVGATLGGVAGDVYAAGKQSEATREANATSYRIHQENVKMQKEFAQHGIRWRVEDAVAAGLSPLAAIGTSGASYSPSSPQIFADDAKAELYRGLSNKMGQGIARAVGATMTREERVMQTLQLERAALQNDLLRAQISSISQPQNPAIPSDWGLNIPGQGDSSSTMVDPVPLKRTHSIPGAPYADVGHVADFAFARTPHGLAVVPSKDVKERVEDQLIPETMWAMRNSLTPNFPGNHFPVPTTREYPLPENFRKMGYQSWKWSYTQQQFVPSKRPEGSTFWGEWKKGMKKNWDLNLDNWRSKKFWKGYKDMFTGGN